MGGLKKERDLKTLKRTKKSVDHVLGQQRSGTLASASVCSPGTWYDKNNNYLDNH